MASKRIDKSSHSIRERFEGRHRHEHWYVDNQVYFITARVKDRIKAFASDSSKAIFWTKFDQYTQQFDFTPFVTTLLDNHYHTLGYLRVGRDLGLMMQRIHGSVAKLVNDQLPERITPFWRERKGRDYFDGCIRDEHQCRRAFRYTMMQGVRHRIVRNWSDYRNTRVSVDLDRAVRRALELRAFMEAVPYPRYGNRAKRAGP